MERFGKLTLRIKNLDPNVALHHLITARRPGPFVDSLCKKPTLDLDELRARAAKFMQLEELREFRNQAQIGENAEKGKGKEKNNAQQFKQREHKPPRFAYYTPLNANRGRILEEALNADLIPSLQRLPTPRNTDTNKHCRYHQNYGHNTIPGGFTGGGPSALGRKKHLRNVQAVQHVYTRMARSMPPITFTDRDFKAIDPKQDDPMVITVTIDEFVVMKTLVDQGSSVDILYWKTFKKLMIRSSDSPGSGWTLEVS